MTIRHLKVFLAVAETGKMSAAADQLFIAQPSVSQAIADIENTIMCVFLNGFPASFTSRRQVKGF